MLKSFVVLSLCMILVPGLKAASTTVPLDGTWEVGEETSAGVRPATWDKITIPGTPKSGSTVWLRRSFDLPRLDGRAILRFSMANFSTKVWVNGSEAGGHYGGFTPFELDVTPFTHQGSNLLEVRVEDSHAIQGDQPTGAGLVPLPPGAKSYVAPAGSTMSVWGLVDSVTLDLVPTVYIADVYVKPSVSTKSVSSEVTLRNAGTASFHGVVSLDIMDGAKRMASFPGQSVSLDPGGESAVKCGPVSAERLSMWWPHSPKLYHLVARLADDSRRTLHESTVRFGYREFRVDGERFSLNGVKMDLAASGLHYFDYGTDPKKVYEEGRRSGLNIIRLHAQPRESKWYDLADEMGMLLVDESAMYGSFGNFAIGEPSFWESCRNHIRGWVRRDRNHPSVAIWSMSNEMGWDGKGAICYPEMKKLYDVIRSIDDTRPVMADGDGDVVGVLPIVNLHYPENYPGNTFPESTYWLETKPVFPGYYGNSDQSLRGKPVYMGEFSSDYANYTGEPAIVGGDRAFLGFEEMLKLRGETVRKFIEGYRWSGFAGIAPWTVFETGPLPNPYSRAQAIAHRPIALLMRDVDTRFYAGSTVVRRMMLLNDSLARHEFHVEWALSDGVRTVQSDALDLRLDPADHHRFDIRLHMPQVDERTDLTFTARVTESGPGVESMDCAYKVFPTIRHEPWKPGESVLLYEPTGGQTSICLERLGLRFTKVGKDELSSLAASGVLVIGAGCASVDLAAWLDRFVDSGGVVVCLEQRRAALPSKAHLMGSGDPYAMSFVRDPLHPIWRTPWRIVNDDLRWWHGGQVVCDDMLGKPAQGAFRVLSDGGFGNRAASFVEFLSGDGRWLATQLKLVSSFDSEPMAAEILGRTLRYALDCASVRQPSVKIGVLADDAFTRRPRARGVEFTKLDGLSPESLNGLSLLLLQGRRFEAALLRSPKGVCGVLRRFAEAGGTVYMRDLSIMSEGPLQALLAGMEWGPGAGNQVTLTVEHALTRGLGNSDLCWLDKGWSNPEGSAEAIGSDLFRVPGAQELTKPGLLQELRIGKGRVVIDQIGWLGAKSSKAQFVGATILTNLGVGSGPSRGEDAGPASDRSDRSDASDMSDRSDNPGSGLSFTAIASPLHTTVGKLEFTLNPGGDMTNWRVAGKPILDSMYLRVLNGSWGDVGDRRMETRMSELPGGDKLIVSWGDYSFLRVKQDVVVGADGRVRLSFQARLTRDVTQSEFQSLRYHFYPNPGLVGGSVDAMGQSIPLAAKYSRNLLINGSTDCIRYRSRSGEGLEMRFAPAIFALFDSRGWQPNPASQPPAWDVPLEIGAYTKAGSTMSMSMVIRPLLRKRHGIAPAVIGPK